MKKHPYVLYLVDSENYEAQEKSILNDRGYLHTDKFTDINKALDYCRDNGTVLASIYTGEFSSNPNLINRVLDEGISLSFLDNPNIDELILTIVIALGQTQSKQRSEKITEGLNKAKKRGVILGTPQNLSDKAREKALEIRRRNSQLANTELGEIIIKKRKLGLNNSEIARWLNGNGYTTRNGKEIRNSEVERIYFKFKNNE